MDKGLLKASAWFCHSVFVMSVMDTHIPFMSCVFPEHHVSGRHCELPESWL